MRKTIARTIKSSTVYGYKITVVENEEPKITELDPVTVIGVVTQKEGMRLLKSANPDAELVTVSKVDVTEDTYKISLDDFIKYGRKVNSNAEQTDEPETQVN